MKKGVWIAILVIVLFGGLTFWLIKTPGKAGALDSFATCLKDNGVKFYGAFWCPHCRNQKALFGRSADLLPYIECSNPDGQTQNQVCNDAKIAGYPTWEFTKSFSLESPTPPHKCTGQSNESSICKNSYRPDLNVWEINSMAIVSNSEPARNASSTWSFAPGARLGGEVPLEELSQLSNCPLPKT